MAKGWPGGLRSLEFGQPLLKCAQVRKGEIFYLALESSLLSIPPGPVLITAGVDDQCGNEGVVDGVD